jgi:hypothetical protein
LPVTVPSSLLRATTRVLLKALVNVPVEPLFSAAERTAPAVASPFTLLSVRVRVLLSVAVTVSVVVSVDVFVPVSPLVWSLAAAKAVPQTPNAKAIADANSVFFMEAPG